MNEPPARPDALLLRMTSLADPTRLRLLRVLERHELGVAELMDVLQLPQSTVSRHLKVLSDGGWLLSRAHGTTNLYRMGSEELEGSARRLWLVAREQTQGWAALEQDNLRLEQRLKEKREGAEAFFAGAAGAWDRLREELYGRRYTELALRALVDPGWVVADLACGSGAVAAEVAPWVSRVVAVDRSAAMLRAARRRLARLGNVELRQGDLEELPLEDGSCDAALLLLALTYVADAPRAVAEMARVLRPGGRAVIVDLLRHDREDFRLEMKQQCLGFEAAELVHLLEQAGLVAASCQPLPPEPGTKGPALLLAAARRPADDGRPSPGCHGSRASERRARTR